MAADTLNLPSDVLLPSDNILTSNRMLYVIVGDDAFPLKRHIMKPYAQRGLPDGKRLFNYRLSRARRTSENAFGILASVFRIFFTKISIDPHFVKLITLACCILHNLLRTLSKDSYTPRNFVDYVDDQGRVTDGQWRNEGQSLYLSSLNSIQGRKSTYEAEDVRNRLEEYFQMNGAVQWQYQHIYTN